METIDFDLKLNKVKNKIKYTLIYLIFTITYLIFKGIDNFISIMILSFVILGFVNIIINIVEYYTIKYYLKEKQYGKCSFDDSFTQYNQKSKQNNNQKNYYKKQTFYENWDNFRNTDSKKRENVREKIKREREYQERLERERIILERIRERLEQERKYRQQQREYQEWFNNKNTNNRRTSTNKQSDKISNAFKLMNLTEENTIQEIKSRYRILAIKWHPDKWSTDSKENQEIANRNFQKLINAYDLIKGYKNIK